MHGVTPLAALAVDDMLAVVTEAPDAASTVRVLADRRLAGAAAIAAVGAAVDLVGGGAYVRPHPLERHTAP